MKEVAISTFLHPNRGHFRQERCRMDTQPKINFCLTLFPPQPLIKKYLKRVDKRVSVLKIFLKYLLLSFELNFLPWEHFD